jgi:predicted DNA-binding transcriptional regulator YafY
MKKPHPSPDRQSLSQTGGLSQTATPSRRGGSQKKKRKPKENRERAGENEGKKARRKEKAKANKPSRKMGWRPPNHRIQGIHEALAWQFDHPESGKPLLNCQSLAEQYMVVPETIRRDIEFMQNTHRLPIEYVPSRHGYVYTEKVTHLPTTQFTQSELAALCFARMRADAYQRTSFDDALNSALDKLLLCLGPEFAAEAKRMEELISFRPSGFPAMLSLETFETIYAALRQQVELEMNYVSFHGENAGKKTGRTVQPRHMTCHDNGWYLITDDLRSGKDRTFLLSRVESVNATGRRFIAKKKLDLKKLKKNLGIFSTENEVTVRLHCQAEIRQLIVERLWHESQEITELADGAVELKMKVGITPELVKLICGWQGYARVIEPEVLRKQVRDAGQRLAAG